VSKFVKRFVKNESGATAIEYGLIAASIAVVIITCRAAVGYENLTATFTSSPARSKQRRQSLRGRSARTALRPDFFFDQPSFAATWRKKAAVSRPEPVARVIDLIRCQAITDGIDVFREPGVEALEIAVRDLRRQAMLALVGFEQLPA